MDFDRKRRQQEAQRKSWFEKSWILAIVLIVVSAVVLIMGYMYVSHLNEKAGKPGTEPGSTTAPAVPGPETPGPADGGS